MSENITNEQLFEFMTKIYSDLDEKWSRYRGNPGTSLISKNPKTVSSVWKGDGKPCNNCHYMVYYGI